MFGLKSGQILWRSRGSTKQRPDLDSVCLKTFCLTILMDLIFSYFFLFKIWAIFPCLKRGQLPVSAQGSSHRVVSLLIQVTVTGVFIYLSHFNNMARSCHNYFTHHPLWLKFSGRHPLFLKNERISRIHSLFEYFFGVNLTMTVPYMQYGYFCHLIIIFRWDCWRCLSQKKMKNSLLAVTAKIVHS